MNKSVFKDGNNQAQTNSLLATEKFGKEHRNVLQAIRAHLGLLEIQQTSECLQKPPMYASLILNPLISGN